MAKVEISIKVNGEPLRLLQQVKQQVNTLEIMNAPEGMMKLINRPQEVADWLYRLSQKAESISYNGILMTPADIDKWKRT